MRTLLALQSVATSGFLKMMLQVATRLKLLLPNQSVEGVLTRASVLSGEYRMKRLVYGVA
jgi:hypothetical protein